MFQQERLSLQKEHTRHKSIFKMEEEFNNQQQEETKDQFKSEEQFENEEQIETKDQFEDAVTSEDEYEEEDIDVDIIETDLDNEDIDELISHLQELKETKSSFNYQLAEDTELVINHTEPQVSEELEE